MVQWANDPCLERVTRAIVDGVQPTRIILFGSRARGDARNESDYDLVVELPFDDYFECRHRVLGAMYNAKPDARIDILIRNPGQLEQRRNDPGYMDWDIAREGVIVYPPGADSSVLRPTPSVVRESEPFKSVYDWLARAAEDLKAIEANLAAGEHGSWSAVCFHAQQTAEKYLKVLFVLRGVHPPRTHSLGALVDELRGLGVEIPKYEAECKLLEPYAVAVRYPEDAPIPDETTGRLVLDAARVIIATAERLREG